MSFFLSMCKNMESVCLSDGWVDFIKSRKRHHITGGHSDAGRCQVWTDRLRLFWSFCCWTRGTEVFLCADVNLRTECFCSSEESCCCFFFSCSLNVGHASIFRTCYLMLRRSASSHLLIIISQSLTRKVLTLQCTALFYNTTLWRLHLSIHEWNKPVPVILTERGW